MEHSLEQMRRINGVTTLFLSKGIRNVLKISVHIINGFLFKTWVQRYEKTYIPKYYSPDLSLVFNIFYTLPIYYYQLHTHHFVKKRSEIPL